MELVNSTKLSLNELIPPVSLFSHHGTLHDRRHIGRVLINAWMLLDLLQKKEYTIPLWATVYLHDIAREHDGVSYHHGQDAIDKLDANSDLQSFLQDVGIADEDWPAIRSAVSYHSWPHSLEPERTHEYWMLIAMLKDADALDRIRIGDMNPNLLRFPESRWLVPFAISLYHRTKDMDGTDENLFTEFWQIAQELIPTIKEIAV
ncbi:MAG: hypothetical protein OEM52_12460 [bacterium]|nr:hypothetical protein [bacterium]